MTRPAPLLVFLGPGLDGIEQTAASARRRGVETLWVGMPYSARLRARARLFCDGVASVDSHDELVALLCSLELDRVVDLMCSEPVIARVRLAAEEVADAGLPPDVLADVRRRHALADKLKTRAVLAAHGVAVPPGLDAATASAAEAAGRLGLPLVVKGVLGSSGATVRITDDVDEAQRIAEVLLRREGCYFERLVPGQESAYVASYAPGGAVLQEGSYTSVKSAKDPTGFPGRVVTENRPDLLEVGRRLVDAVGGRGLMNADMITDAHGRVWVLDVNPRPWHTTVALRHTGTDFVGGYLHALGVGPRPPEPVRLPGGQTVDGFPREAAELIRRRPGEGVRMLGRQSRTFRDWTGPGYVVASTFRVGMTIGARLYRDLMQSGHPITGHLPLLGEYKDEIGPTPTRRRR